MVSRSRIICIFSIYILVSWENSPAVLLYCFFNIFKMFCFAVWFVNELGTPVVMVIPRFTKSRKAIIYKPPKPNLQELMKCVCSEELERYGGVNSVHQTKTKDLFYLKKTFKYQLQYQALQHFNITSIN